MKILITGSAGFIGMHLVVKLIEENNEIVGLDNINDFYDVNLKFARLNETGILNRSIFYNQILQSNKFPNYKFIQLSLQDKENLLNLFKKEKFDIVINLAAQTGVRNSVINPDEYINSNILGFQTILEACRNFTVQHLIFASSSSVYGLNKKMPFSVHHNADHPLSVYAATKRSNELLAHAYSYLFAIPSTGLRFFTVYGPWGRPDMAVYVFTKKILENKAIQVFNNGNLSRDFTYSDDIIKGLSLVIKKPPKISCDSDIDILSPAKSVAPFRIFNLGNSSPVNIMDLIKALENATGKKARIEYKPLQPGDVKSTWADMEDLSNEFSYKPDTPLQKGIDEFVKWYKLYHCG